LKDFSRRVTRLKVRIIVAEKNLAAKRIACALCEDHECEKEEGCPHGHTDIFIHYNGLEGCSEMHKMHVPCSITPRGRKPFYFKCSPNTCSTYVASTGREGTLNTSRIWKRIRSWKEKRIIPERVKYFELYKENVKTIILATNGNMLEMKLRGNLCKRIKACEEWEMMNQSLEYRPRRGYFIKWFLLEELLVNNHFGEVDELFFATDYDIAGSYIALSILEKVNRGRVKNGKEIIPLSHVRRLLLKTVAPEEIRSELEKPQEFDWGNALGGKLRTSIDYLFGTTLTTMLDSQLKKTLHLKKVSENLKRIGIGRVRFPSLWFIIKRDWEAAQNKFTYAIYFLFNGYNTVAEVNKAIEHRDFSAFLVKEHKSHYSQSQFIKDLAANQVGTHTTRLTAVEKLKEGGLIFIDGQKRIRGTKRGLQYYNALRSRLSTDSYDFASLEFNRQLYEDISSLTVLDQKIKDNTKLFEACQHYYDEFMQFYYKNIRELVLKFENSKLEVATLMASLFSESHQKEEPTILLESSYRKSDSTVIIKENEPVDIEKVEKEFGSLDNFNIEREFKKLDLNSHIRLLLQIPRENDFQILGVFKVDALAHLNEDNAVLFKTQLGDDPELCKKKFMDILERVAEGTLSLSSVEKIETLEFKKRMELAHEPLHTVNLQYRNVEGEKGKLLIMEYDRPYIRTLRQLLHFRLGLVKAFTLGGLKFELVDPYELFEAHNFESMLFTMHEKYGIDLDKTAKMMQSLYLGGGE
jgi:DNA topoisomerase IA